MIKVTNLSDRSIWLNPAYIVSVSDLHGITVIAVQSGDRIQLYEVRETVEQLIEEINPK